jgi:hypothetical protein
MNRQAIPNQAHIRWRQVWGLAALIAAILISFIAYGYYQPKILQSLGFFSLAAWLGIFQGFLGAILEPVVGRLSDRIFRRVGSRLPQISVGVTLAGLIFVILAILFAVNLPNALRWLIPLLMTLWVMAMIVFRGPAIALLRQFAPTEGLPLANAALVIVFGLVGAASPALELLLKRLGTSPAFLLGAIALILGAAALYAVTPKHAASLPAATAPAAPAPTPLHRLLGLFLVGMGAGVEINLLLSLIPQALTAHFPSSQPQLMSSGILLVAAFAAVPLGELAVKFDSGLRLAMGIGLGAIAVLMGVALLINSIIGALCLIFAFGLVLGVVFIDQIPFALISVAPSQAGLGTGLYFGGMGAGSALASLVVKQLGSLTLLGGTIWVAIASALAGLCLVKLMK